MSCPPFFSASPSPCPSPPPLLRPPLQWRNVGGRWEPEKWDDLLLLTYSLTNVVLLPFPALLHTLISLLPKFTEMLFFFATLVCFQSPSLQHSVSLCLSNFWTSVLSSFLYLKEQLSLPSAPSQANAFSQAFLQANTETHTIFITLYQKECNYKMKAWHMVEIIITVFLGMWYQYISEYNRCT